MFLLKRALALAVAVAAVTAILPRLLPTETLSTTVAIRGAYGRDSSSTGVDIIKGAGLNAVGVMPYKDHLDRLHAAGMQGVVWLWGYTKDGCRFHHTDDQIRAEVSAIAGHPAIAAYQVADEPNYARREGCPQVVDQMKARHGLVKALDPSTPTYLTISTWDGYEGYPYQYFASVTDVMGLVVYPYGTHASQPHNIDTAIAEADRDGVPRYWAVMQAYGDGYYRIPTYAELQDQFVRWSRSRMEGYFLYHWNQQAPWMTDWCATYSYCVEAVKAFNHSQSAVPTLTPTTTSSPTATSSPTPSPSAQPTTSIPPDTTPPSVPGSLTATWVKRSISLAWSASTDDTGVAAYRIYRDGNLIRTTTATSIWDRPKTNASHRYEVVAVDAAGNASSAAVATVPAPTPTAKWWSR